MHRIAALLLTAALATAGEGGEAGKPALQLPVAESADPLAATVGHPLDVYVTSDGTIHAGGTVDAGEDAGEIGGAAGEGAGVQPRSPAELRWWLSRAVRAREGVAAPGADATPRVPRPDLCLRMDRAVPLGMVGALLRVAALARVGRIWIVTARADGSEGVFPLFLPSDPGPGLPAVEPREERVLEFRLQATGERQIEWGASGDRATVAAPAGARFVWEDHEAGAASDLREPVRAALAKGREAPARTLRARVQADERASVGALVELLDVLRGTGLYVDRWIEWASSEPPAERLPHLPYPPQDARATLATNAQQVRPIGLGGGRHR